MFMRPLDLPATWLAGEAEELQRLEQYEAIFSTRFDSALIVALITDDH
jgi:hypothetical protein